MNCLVLAGGIPPPGHSLHAHAGGQPKVLIEVGRRSILRRVLEAVDGSHHIDRIVVAGLPASTSLPGGPAAELVADAGGPVANLFAGIDRLVEIGSRQKPFVYCWGDLPLLTTELVDRFLEAIDGAPYEITVGLVQRARIEALRPAIETTYLRLHEGQFKSTDLGTAVPDAAYRVRGYLEALAPRRKSLLELARIVSPTLMVRYATGRLRRDELARRVSRKVGAECGIVVAEQAEMCMDVDDDIDLAWCREHVAATVYTRA